MELRVTSYELLEQNPKTCIPMLQNSYLHQSPCRYCLFRFPIISKSHHGVSEWSPCHRLCCSTILSDHYANAQECLGYQLTAISCLPDYVQSSRLRGKSVDNTKQSMTEKLTCRSSTMIAGVVTHSVQVCAAAAIASEPSISLALSLLPSQRH